MVINLQRIHDVRRLRLLGVPNGRARRHQYFDDKLCLEFQVGLSIVLVESLGEKTAFQPEQSEEVL